VKDSSKCRNKSLIKNSLQLVKSSLRILKLFLETTSHFCFFVRECFPSWQLRRSIKNRHIMIKSSAHLESSFQFFLIECVDAPSHSRKQIVAYRAMTKVKCVAAWSAAVNAEFVLLNAGCALMVMGICKSKYAKSRKSLKAVHNLFRVCRTSKCISHLHFWCRSSDAL